MRSVCIYWRRVGLWSVCCVCCVSLSVLTGGVLVSGQCVVFAVCGLSVLTGGMLVSGQCVVFAVCGLSVLTGGVLVSGQCVVFAVCGLSVLTGGVLVSGQCVVFAVWVCLYLLEACWSLVSVLCLLCGSVCTYWRHVGLWSVCLLCLLCGSVCTYWRRVGLWSVCCVCCVGLSVLTGGVLVSGQCVVFAVWVCLYLLETCWSLVSVLCLLCGSVCTYWRRVGLWSVCCVCCVGLSVLTGGVLVSGQCVVFAVWVCLYLLETCWSLVIVLCLLCGSVCTYWRRVGLWSVCCVCCVGLSVLTGGVLVSGQCVVFAVWVCLYLLEACWSLVSVLCLLCGSVCTYWRRVGLWSVCCVCCVGLSVLTGGVLVSGQCVVFAVSVCLYLLEACWSLVSVLCLLCGSVCTYWRRVGLWSVCCVCCVGLSVLTGGVLVSGQCVVFAVWVCLYLLEACWSLVSVLCLLCGSVCTYWRCVGLWSVCCVCCVGLSVLTGGVLVSGQCVVFAVWVCLYLLEACWSLVSVLCLLCGSVCTYWRRVGLWSVCCVCCVGLSVLTGDVLVSGQCVVFAVWVCLYLLEACWSLVSVLCLLCGSVCTYWRCVGLWSVCCVCCVGLSVLTGDVLVSGQCVVFAVGGLTEAGAAGGVECPLEVVQTQL